MLSQNVIADTADYNRKECHQYQNVKKQDRGSASSKAANHKQADCANPTLGIILSSGSEPESLCSLEMQYAFCVKDSESLPQRQLQTTSSPCVCAIERTTDFTTSRLSVGYAPPVMPGSQAVKHTVKHDRPYLCPICRGCLERRDPDIEVR